MTVTAEEGMTWRKFVESKYNPTDDYGNKIFSIENVYAYGIYWYIDPSAADGQPYRNEVFTWDYDGEGTSHAFLADEEIIDGNRYTWNE